MTPDLEVVPTPELAAEAAAARFVAAAREAIQARGTFLVALSGGKTPRAMYERLAAEPNARAVDWPRMHVLWGDERRVPPDQLASNYRMAREALLDRVPIPAANVHRIRGEVNAGQAAAEYEGTLRGLLHTPAGPPRPVAGARIDLVLLGLGSDGHTASLFPGVVADEADERWVRASYIKILSSWRVTLAPSLINAAAEIAFLVTGTAKAAIVRQVLEGSYRPDLLPAQAIAPVAGRLTWYLDALAASELNGGMER